MNNQIIPSDLGLTKQSIQFAASNAVDAILEKGNVIEAAEMLSATEAFIKDVKAHNRFVPYLREEIEKSGKSLTRPSGTKIELAEVGTKYDYSKCEDLTLTDLELKLSGIEKKVKQRQEFLKTVPVEGLVVTDEQTGETFKVYPPSKTSTSSYKITLAK